MIRWIKRRNGSGVEQREEGGGAGASLDFSGLAEGPERIQVTEGVVALRRPLQTLSLLGLEEALLVDSRFPPARCIQREGLGRHGSQQVQR